MNKCYLLLLITMPLGWLHAQLPNEPLSSKYIIDTTRGQTWGIDVENFNYLRNTEYFNSIESGRTLFGYQLHPALFIQPTSKFQLRAGAFIRSDFGATPVINQILPTFTAQIQTGSHSRFIFGTLEGALAHRIIEPLWDINSAIERRIENGAQFKRETQKQFLDTWIHWERYIERGSPYKEQFTAGFSFQQQVIHSESGWYLNIPLQGIAHHRGGQIDTDSSNMVMQFNGATGIQLGKTSQGWLSEWRLDAYATAYRENSNSGYFPYRSGSGAFINMLLRHQNMSTLFSYWQGNQWIAPRGTSLYSAVSLDSPGKQEADRRLIFVRFCYQKNISNNLALACRLEPVYDVKSSLLDYSYSLYIAYQLHQKLGRLP